MFLFLQALKADGAILYLKFAGVIDLNVVVIKYALTKCENGFLTLSLPLSVCSCLLLSLCIIVNITSKSPG